MTPGELDAKTRRRAWTLAAPPAAETSSQTAFAAFGPSKPQLNAPKAPGGEPSQPAQPSPDAKTPPGQPSTAFTPTEQHKHHRPEGAKATKADQHLLSANPPAPDPDTSEGTPA
jgi:hypothetical protein